MFEMPWLGDEMPYEVVRAKLLRFLRDTVVPAVEVDDYDTLTVRVYTAVHYDVSIHHAMSYVGQGKYTLVGIRTGIDWHRERDSYFELDFAGQYAMEALL